MAAYLGSCNIRNEFNLQPEQLYRGSDVVAQEAPVLVISGNFLPALHELFTRDMNCSVEQLLLTMSIHAVTLEQFTEAYYMQSMWYNQLKVHASEGLAVSLPRINSRLWVRIALVCDRTRTI